MELTLTLTAFILGSLAWFEPCTIATHTLFTARIHRETASHCCAQLFIVWLSRSVLSITLLVLILLILPTPNWSPSLPSIILSVMALLYLVTRVIYIPIPHLSFYHLLPFNGRFTEAVKLGMTLPACTLPLFVIIIGLTITVQNIWWTMFAGLLFATGFSLPMIITGLNGISPSVQDFLQHAAKGSPYLTAILLFAAAIYLYLPQLDLSSTALKATLTQASWAGLGLSFMAGLIFSFNPVSFASIPVILAYVTKANEERRAILMGGAFVFGMILTHVSLGVVAAISGDSVKSVLGREWGLLLGPVLILLGLSWPGWIKLRLPWIGMRAKKVTGLWGAFLLAIPFSVAVCPFCTPALLVTLTASAAIGSVSFGFGLLLAFALGRSIPIILGAWSIGWLESLKILSQHQRIFEIIAGIVLIVSGLYLLNEYFFIIEM